MEVQRAVQRVGDAVEQCVHLEVGAGARAR